MTLRKYRLQGASGSTIGDGTAATLANLEIVDVPPGAVFSSSGVGGSITFRTAAKFIGTYGVRIISGTNAAYIRFPPAASSLTMAVTAAIETPATPPTGTNLPTIWNMVATSGTPLRLLYNSSRHLLLQKVTGSNIDLGAFSDAQQLIIRCWVTIGTSTTGILNFELQTPGGGTIAGTTVAVTNADLGTSPVAYSALAASTGVPAESYQVDIGYMLLDDGRTSFIPQEVDVTPALDSGSINAVVSAGAWTAPTGTLLGNLTDADGTTVARSPVATSTTQYITLGYPRMTPKAALVLGLPFAKSPGAVGDGQIICELWDGATMRGTQTFNTATDGVPNTVTWGSSVTSTITLDSGGAWAGLTMKIGVKV